MFWNNFMLVVTKYGHLFLEGTLMTLKFSAVAVIGGVIFGALLALMRLSEFKIGNSSHCHSWPLHT